MAKGRADASACGLVREPLPELAGVYWRPLASADSVRRRGWLWTLTTIAHTLPFVAAAALLVALKPLTFPVGLVLVAHAWLIPELYAARGANVLKSRASPERDAELRATGLVGDLLDHQPRDLFERTGLVVERGQLGTWLLGEAGAVLVRRGGRRIDCYCVKATDAALPPSDRVAHLLLALRSDEAGLATVANLAFSGARWRLRRRICARAREALDAAVGFSRSG